jgi:dihydroorotate dehydrogenase electron transfer subunit
LSGQTFPGIFDTFATVISQRPSGSVAYTISFRCEEIARAARPIQFFMTAVRPTPQDGVAVDNPPLDPLLRRPLGFSEVRPEKGEFDAIYQVVGRGTKLLSELKPGQRVRMLGPLGIPLMPEDIKAKAVILAGGGLGLPPLYHLAPALLDAGKEVICLAGARAKDILIMDAAKCKLKRPLGGVKETAGLKPFVDLGMDCVVTLDTPADGFLSGLITIPLEKYMKGKYDGGVEVVCCGPPPMLKAVTKMALENKIKCRLVMEARFGCALGACQSCVCKTKSGYRRVCTEGPVFNAEDIVWD